MDKISIVLSPVEWNIVLHALAKRPYEEVFNLMADIRRQAEGQLPSGVDKQVNVD